MYCVYTVCFWLELAKEEFGGLSDADRLRRCLENLKAADAGSVVRYKTNSSNELDGVFFATSGMIDIYRQFPEVLFFDGTYKYGLAVCVVYSYLP